MKKILGMMAALMIVGGMASAQDEQPVDPTETTPGISCDLLRGGDQDTPGDMLNALTARDGHFQRTVNDLSFSDQFASVGDLIDQKCETASEAE